MVRPVHGSIGRTTRADRHLHYPYPSHMRIQSIYNPFRDVMGETYYGASKVEDIQVRVCLFAFDLLYLNGEVSPSVITILGWR